tara:strand:+ start:725 stop:1303 length:579 start_codon:yes stop_codon:yes gene_type:complete
MVEILDYQGYDMSKYITFSINEIDAMYNNNQLDFMAENHSTHKKTFVKYHLHTKQLKKNILEEMIQELFYIEKILTKDDTLVVIVDDEPNDTIITEIKYLYDKRGIFVVLHKIKRLQFNILNHTLVPKCDVLNVDDITAFKKQYNILDINKIPEISRFDPQALAMSLRPGQVCKFHRNSITSMENLYYRICI